MIRSGYSVSADAELIGNRFLTTFEYQVWRVQSSGHGENALLATALVFHPAAGRCFMQLDFKSFAPSLISKRRRPMTGIKAHNRIAMLIICMLGVLILRIVLAQAAGQLTPYSSESKGLSVEAYIRAIEELEAKGEPENAIREAQKAVLAFPDDERCYSLLRAMYVKAREYAKALKVSKRLIDITKVHNFSPCGYVLNHAWILEHSEGEDSAISFLGSYRRECSGTDDLIMQMKRVKSGEEKALPMFD
jgi:tetratricopeptide (TPR) repeat protein